MRGFELAVPWSEASNSPYRPGDFVVSCLKFLSPVGSLQDANATRLLGNRRNPAPRPGPAALPGRAVRGRVLGQRWRRFGRMRGLGPPALAPRPADPLARLPGGDGLAPDTREPEADRRGARQLRARRASGGARAHRRAHTDWLPRHPAP